MDTGGTATAARFDVRPGRIQAQLRGLARIGYSADGGMNRLAFTRQDLRARQLLLHILGNLGIEPRIDPFGNVFGRIPGTGRAADDPPLLLGSHIDTVPGGGRFDGSVGMVAALEVAALVAEHRIETRHPIEIVSFACEESSRFGRGTMGSGIVAGIWGPDEILGLTDARGIRLEQALQRAGLEPRRLAEARRAPGDFLAYLEIHIEQGRVLEEAGLQVGVVDGIAAPTRFRAQLIGHADHSGATPMGLRHDALAAAAEVILAVERFATAAGNVVGTVGTVRVDPGAINVIPGRVELGIDVRSTVGSAKAAVVQRIRDEIDAICRARDLTHQIVVMTDEEPVRLDPRVVAELERRAAQRGLPSHRMPSGAGHDAMQIARLCPAGMLMVPSRGGISHHRDEWTSLDDIVAGIQVYADAALTIADQGVPGR
jgi:hydantoinase/carbamoylase family amidase